MCGKFLGLKSHFGIWNKSSKYGICYVYVQIPYITVYPPKESFP